MSILGVSPFSRLVASNSGSARHGCSEADWTTIFAPLNHSNTPSNDAPLALNESSSFNFSVPSSFPIQPSSLLADASIISPKLFSPLDSISPPRFGQSALMTGLSFSPHLFNVSPLNCSPTPTPSALTCSLSARRNDELFPKSGSSSSLSAPKESYMPTASDLVTISSPSSATSGVSRTSLMESDDASVAASFSSLDEQSTAPSPRNNSRSHNGKSRPVSTSTSIDSAMADLQSDHYLAFEVLDIDHTTGAIKSEEKPFSPANVAAFDFVSLQQPLDDLAQSHSNVKRETPAMESYDDGEHEYSVSGRSSPINDDDDDSDGMFSSTSMTDEEAISCPLCAHVFGMNVMPEHVSSCFLRYHGSSTRRNSQSHSTDSSSSTSVRNKSSDLSSLRSVVRSMSPSHRARFLASFRKLAAKHSRRSSIVDQTDATVLKLLFSPALKQQYWSDGMQALDQDSLSLSRCMSDPSNDNGMRRLSLPLLETTSPVSNATTLSTLTSQASTPSPMSTGMTDHDHSFQHMPPLMMPTVRQASIVSMQPPVATPANIVHAMGLTPTPVMAAAIDNSLVQLGTVIPETPIMAQSVAAPSVAMPAIATPATPTAAANVVPASPIHTPVQFARVIGAPLIHTRQSISLPNPKKQKTSKNSKTPIAANCVMASPVIASAIVLPPTSLAHNQPIMANSWV